MALTAGTHSWQLANNAGIRRVISSGILLLLLAAHLTAQAEQFEWRDRFGNARSLSDLREILREHQQWTESGKKAGTRADLADATLTGADLTRANLTRADLTHANLTNAILGGVNLSNANLFYANLTGTYLYANLSGAKRKKL